jgi:hypothetical protein
MEVLRIIRDKPIFSSERSLHKDYDRKGLVEKKTAVKVIGVKPPVVN